MMITDYGAVTLGGEAMLVRNVVVENYRVFGAMSVLHSKLRRPRSARSR